MKRIIAQLVLIFAVSACGSSRKGDNGVRPVFPGYAGSPGDATSRQQIGILGAGGGSRITMDLQRMPPATSANLWACWSVPDDNFALGQAVCASNTQNTIEITAANVDFTCSANPSFGVVKAKTTISLGSCASYKVFAYRLDTPLPMQVGN